MKPPALLAVDGGNSKTDVAVVGSGGELLATARGAGFRPHNVGLGPAVETLSGVVAEALERAGSLEVAHLAASLAGADLPDDEEALQKALLARAWAPSVQVGNDTFAVLRSTASAPWGVAVVCGAGINCVGVGPDGEVTRFPSLGHLTGDWGGGAKLGSTALWHAVRAEDGRGPRTALTGAVAAHFGVERAIDVGLAIHAGDIEQERLGELAPALLDAAEAGDPIARELSDRLAGEVALLGTVALRRLGLLEVAAEVVLGGGVLAARRPVLMTAVAERYAAMAPKARLLIPEAPPLLGAALLGLDHLGAPPSAYATLTEAFRR